MTNELIEQYYINLHKLEKGEWKPEQWYDYCTMVLGELMEEHYFHSSQESLIQPTNNMEQQIKLTYEDGDSTIEFSINPHITLDKMVENMECFLKAIGYQFDSLEYTKRNNY